MRHTTRHNKRHTFSSKKDTIKSFSALIISPLVSSDEDL